MKLVKGQRSKWTVLVALLLFSMLIAACGSANNGGSTSTTPTASGPDGKGCKKIGVSLPETNTSYRWDNQDRPLLQSSLASALSVPTSNILINNAGGDKNVQQTQVDAMLSQGACILVVAPYDAQSAVAIVTKAKAQHVPVVAYDRLIPTKSLTAYVSFDGVQVGKVQGQYIADNYQKYVTQNGNNNAAFIDGSQTDNNALLFKQGLHDVVDPLIQSNKLKNTYEQFTDWTAPVAQQDINAALSRNNNKLAVAYVANDDMANSVIAALKVVHLDGKVLVTGQDASLQAITNILNGEQAMTVYKPYKQEASKTAEVVAAISNGQAVTSVSGGTTMDSGDGGKVPAYLLNPIAVDKSNVKSTIIADNFYTAEQVCKGVPKGTAGVC